MWKDNGYLGSELYHDMKKKNESTKLVTRQLANEPELNARNQSHSNINYVSTMPGGLGEYDSIQSFL